MPAPSEIAKSVAETMGKINDAWRRGEPEAMAPLLHPNIAMAFPGFAGRTEGRDALVDSYRSFGREARVIEYEPGEIVVDGAGSAAIAQCPFTMTYELKGERWRSTGWDVWAFAREGGKWLAIWRTMQGVAEERADSGPA